MKRLGSRWSENSSSFHLFFFFFTILFFTSNTFGASAPLTLNPSTINFGNVPIGTGQKHSVTLTNSGDSKLSITQATLSQTAFTLTGLSYPLTLTPGQTITGCVTFTPQASGADTGKVSIAFHRVRNPIPKTVMLAVSGTGTTTAGHLTTTPTSVAFGNVQMGNSQTLTATITNSGGSTVTISSASAGGAGFSASGLSLPMTLNSGQSTSVSVTFAPASSSSVSGSLAITSNASDPALNVPLSGTGATPGQLTANPASLSFGNVATGSSTTLAETLTNSGGSPLTISQISPSGAGFSDSAITLPLTLSPAQSVTFPTSFAPKSAGAATGSLLISSNGSNPALSVASTGTGISAGQLTVAPSAINFGNVTVGTTRNQTAIVSASGSPVTVTSLGVSGSQFAVGAITLPVTIAAGNSVSLQLIFAPTATGPASANVTFASNASNSPAIQAITGTGTLLQHSVALGWNISTSNDVVGYNIYRGTAAGSTGTRINSAPDATPSDIDSTVQSGQTYYYVVTAVDSKGVESIYSNQVQAVIPYP